jgi:hypothetical protein
MVRPIILSLPTGNAADRDYRHARLLAVVDVGTPRTHFAGPYGGRARTAQADNPRAWETS